MTISENLPEISVSYYPEYSPTEKVYIYDSTNVSEVVRSIWNPDTLHLFEEFKVLYLDHRNGVLGFLNLCKGTGCQTLVNTRLLFAVALKVNAHSLILCHNHPSGKTEPSNDDRKLTVKLVEGANLLELKILDHIILGGMGYYSFADNGEIL